MNQLRLALLPLALASVFSAQAADPREIDPREIVFEALERQIIAEYSRQHGSGKPAGKKAKGLPPGIAKNLERGKTLPAGIARRQLPAALQAKLPAAPAGHERVIVNGRVLLVDIATGVIRDKLDDILLKD